VVLLLFGPPGCGKGTQSRLIVDWLKIPAISTGDLLRGEMKAGSDLGKAAQTAVAAGGLVSDDLVNQILKARISLPDCSRGFILDGYPRTVEQADFLDGILGQMGIGKPLVLHFDVPADALIGRMTSRRWCPKCGRTYNILSVRPKSPGKCDVDGESLIVRKDDREDVIRERLRAYDEQTRPILAHYEDYHHIQGDRSPAYIFEEITGILEPIVLSNGNATGNCRLQGDPS
jgi:adenylate kinase